MVGRRFGDVVRKTRRLAAVMTAVGAGAGAGTQLLTRGKTRDGRHTRQG